MVHVLVLPGLIFIAIRCSSIELSNPIIGRSRFRYPSDRNQLRSSGIRAVFRGYPLPRRGVSNLFFDLSTSFTISTKFIALVLLDLFLSGIARQKIEHCTSTKKAGNFCIKSRNNLNNFQNIVETFNRNSAVSEKLTNESNVVLLKKYEKNITVQVRFYL